MNEEQIVQEMAESAHEAWLEGCIAMGITSRKAEWGEEFMVPWAELSERGREFDRIIMRAILRKFAEMSMTVVPLDPSSVSYENGMLRRIIGSLGFRIIDGDFTMKDGTKSPINIQPVDAIKIGQQLLRVLEETPR